MLPGGEREQEVSHFKSALEHLDVKLRALQKKQVGGMDETITFWERMKQSWTILDFLIIFYIIWKGAI